MEKQYILSERAHFMCPNMSFAILMKLAGEYDAQKFSDSLDRLAQAHPFLRAVVAYESGSDRLYYDISDASRVSLAVADGAFDISGYEALMKQPRDIFREGLLRVYVYRSPESFEVLLLTHHLLTDGCGLLQLAQELADCYADGKAPAYAEERLISGISDLPDGSGLPWISRALVRRANRQWRKEDRRVSYEEYRAFEADFNSKHRLEYQRYDVDDEAYRAMKAECRENGFTINDLLMAKMYIRTKAKKIIIAADIRKRLDCFIPGAMGNYATAMGIVSGRLADEIAGAKEVHDLVRRAAGSTGRLMTVLSCYLELDPTLLDAAAISGLGGFKSKAASFVGGGMFGFAKPSSYSITNLGKIENKNILSAVFIPPASPAAILTLGAVTVNEKMYCCTSRCV